MGNLLRILYAKDADANKSDIFLDFESMFNSEKYFINILGQIFSLLHLCNQCNQ
jgi:hypothetical protein